MKKLYFLLLTALFAGTTASAQCPSISIDQRYGLQQVHPSFIAHGWDTAVTASHPGMMLTTTDFLTTQNFNGIYLVEEIPYNPPEPFTFGTRMPLTTDDDFAPDSINIDFNFLFFGMEKSSVTLGANGMATFTPGAKGQQCPWNYLAPLPWHPDSVGAPRPTTNMRDAIYGVYEDTSPYHLDSSDRGIYYGVSPQSDFPCRHICFSWNRVPQFGHHATADSAVYNSSYQIAFFEGTNVIEVHVKQRKANPNWNNGNGIIGIQNATGLDQVSTFDNRVGDYTDYILPNSPAAFFPQGFNTFQSDITERAWRFTPQGFVNRNIQFFRLLENGDKVELGSDSLSSYAADAMGYYTSFDRTSCYVYPSMPTRYLVTCRYITRIGHEYVLTDTIFVGVEQDAADTAAAPLFIPDGVDSLASTITVTGFDEGATVTSPDQIRSLCVNLEHSFQSDLNLSLRCPNGSIAYLKHARLFFDTTTPQDYPRTNQSAFLGAPYGGREHHLYQSEKPYNDYNEQYGIGADYCFSRNADYTLVTGDPANVEVTQGSINCSPYLGSTDYVDEVTVVFDTIPFGFFRAGQCADTQTFSMLRPSDPLARLDYYQPVSEYDELIGCPLNGDWTLVVRDVWRMDKGFLFDWNINLADAADTTGITAPETTPIKVCIDNGSIVVRGNLNAPVCLYDMTGRMRYCRPANAAQQETDSSLLIPTTELSSGVYLVRVGNYPAQRVVVVK